jgi:galactitol-specific phosphotransferase system IIC component
MAVGYGISSVFSAIDISWKYGFYIQGLLMIVIAGIFSIIPADIYSHEHDALVELHEETVRKLSVKQTEVLS